MSTVLLKRHFEPGIDRETIKMMVTKGAGCLATYRLDWVESFLCDSGNELICHFEAPDTEAVRSAMRVSKVVYESIWHGSIHRSAAGGECNVMVERYFDEPTTVEAMQALEDKAAWCLETRNVSFVRTYCANDNKSMLCLYRAPDAESVRQAQHQAGMPFERIWAFDNVTPANLG